MRVLAEDGGGLVQQAAWMQEAVYYLGTTWGKSATGTSRPRGAELGTQKLKGIWSLSPQEFSLLGFSFGKPRFPALPALCFRPYCFIGIFFCFPVPTRGFPHSSAGKESARNAGDPGLIPGSGSAGVQSRQDPGGSLRMNSVGERERRHVRLALIGPSLRGRERERESDQTGGAESGNDLFFNQSFYTLS